MERLLDAAYRRGACRLIQNIKSKEEKVLVQPMVHCRKLDFSPVTDMRNVVNRRKITKHIINR
jgi:hypothetical protein